MRTAENIQAHASSGNNAKNAFFSKGGVRNNVHSAIQAKPTPFFNTTQSLQAQDETNELNSSNETVATEEPKVFTKPKSFWVLENDKGTILNRAFYSTETVTIEQLTHAIYKSPLAMLETFSNTNGKTTTQEIPAYTRINIPTTKAAATGWAINGFNSSLVFRGVSRNPFPILAAMGVSSSEEFAHKKKVISQGLELENPLMAMYINWGMEGDFIKILKKYAQLNFTQYPDKYTGGGQYIDKIFVYLRRHVRKIGSFDQVTSSYDLIFNHFKRADEVKQIRDGYSLWFKGDSGTREITYSDVFIEEAFLKALNAAGVPKADIMSFLNKAGNAIADIISNPNKFLRNLIAAVKSGFNQFVVELPSYLGTGLLKLVTGKMGIGNVALPKDFSPKSMLEFSLNTLKLDMRNIVTEVVGAENKERIDKVWGVLQTLMTNGIGGLANQLIEYVVDIKTVFVDKLKNWVIKDLIKSAVSKLLKVLVPGGGLIEVIEKVYEVIQFVRNKLSDLKALFITVGQSVLQIVNGDIEGAASKINGVLKKGLDLLLNLFARLMKINFMDGIRNAVQNLREKIVGGIKKLVEKIVIGGKGIANKIGGWLGFREKFTTDQGVKHTVYIDSGKGRHQLIIKSFPTPVVNFLKEKKQEVSLDQSLESSDKKQQLGKIKHTQNLLKGLEALMSKTTEEDNPRIPKMIAEIIDNIKEIDVNEQNENMVIPKAEFTPEFKRGSDIRATSFAARYVFKGTSTTGPNHEPGSKPSDSALPNAWQVLKDMGLNYRWARFHILNENLGGKGMDSNLIPTPIYINNEYRKELEEDLKGFYNMGLPIWLRANVIYNTANFAGYFPSHYSATAGAMKFENNKWVEDATKKRSFSKQIDIPIPHSFNINKIMNDPREEMLIKNLTSVTEGILKILRARMPEGGYKNYFQMEKAIEMEEYGVQENEINSLDEIEIINLPKPSDEQVKKVNRLKGWMRTALYTFE